MPKSWPTGSRHGLPRTQANVKHTSSHQDMESHAESAQTQATYGNLFVSICVKIDP